MYLHWRGVVRAFFTLFCWGNCGFFTVLGGDDGSEGSDDRRGNEEDVAVLAVAVVDRGVTSPTLYVVVVVVKKGDAG
jgi:hypothetical protein